ncbi:phage tail protein [Planococcaceae bacterium Storch 2/2-2]|nr:phage tail protein [Planococcaceae bacterium Storch 2/2-2]
MTAAVVETLVAYRMFDEEGELQGIADIDLPDLSYLTRELKGAGVAGVVDVPIFGHFESLTATINWRTMIADSMKLMRPGRRLFECRSASQIQDAGTGGYTISAEKIIMGGLVKKGEMGKREVGEGSESSNEFEITYLKIVQDGKTITEIDKLNYICTIDGLDYMDKVRTALGYN